MKPEERKQRFVALLTQLLDECGGVKKKLAKKLGIKPSTLTPWLQGKIDPASLDLGIFIRVAEAACHSTDELAKLLGIVDNSEERVLDRFKSLVQDLLSSQSLEGLGKKLGVTYGAISGWISSQRNVDPRRISIGTIAALAQEKGWTLERLLAYLGLKKIESIQEDLFSKIQDLVVQLSLLEQVKLLAWLSGEFQKQLSSFNTQIPNLIDDKILSGKKVCIILENEDLSLAYRYPRNLELHARLKPENISIATATKIPETLSVFDILVVDVASDESPCISQLERIEFDGALVVFADSGLSEAMRTRLSNQVTDLLIKPIPWNELKDKSYFL